MQIHILPSELVERIIYPNATQQFLNVVWTFAAIQFTLGYPQGEILIPASAMAASWIVAGIGDKSTRYRVGIAGLWCMWMMTIVFGFYRGCDFRLPILNSACYCLVLTALLLVCKSWGWLRFDADKERTGHVPQWSILDILLITTLVAVILALPRILWSLKYQFWAIETIPGPGLVGFSLVKGLLLGPALVLAAQAGELVPRSRDELLARLNSPGRAKRKWLPRGLLMIGALIPCAFIMLPSYNVGPPPANLFVLPGYEWVRDAIPGWFFLIVGFGTIAAWHTAIKFRWNTKLSIQIEPTSGESKR